ncbi:MAG: prepilin-type N-terminal cleavage/methylation domain-containing protein [Candidatus Hydrogenedentes bacterium]|nr:prepilin-type N-terminal cleavage/methylation domain-containing protein [Candidatus Hydrogenedentota bacterium]
MRMQRHQGFTLLEVMVALSILALGILAIMQLFPVSLRQSRIAAERTVVASLAKTELSKVKAGGVGNQLQEWAERNALRTISGVEQAYTLYDSWRSTVQRVQGSALGTVDLFRVTFAVRMLDGREETFVTYVTEP